MVSVSPMNQFMETGSGNKDIGNTRLKESNELLEIIFNNSPVIMLLLNKDKRIKKANYTARELANATEEDLINLRGGEALRCAYHFQDPNGCGFGPNCSECKIRNTVQETFATKSDHYKVETVFPLKINDEILYRNVLVSTAYIGNRDEDMVLVAIDDITDRVLNEKKLEVSESRLKEAEEMAGLGHWELNLETNHLHWSDETYRLFEKDPEKFGTSYEAFLNAIHPDDREFVNEAYTTSVRDKTTYDIEHRLLMKDGRIKYVNEKCKTEYNDSGEPIRSIGTVLDITKQKEFEFELKKLNDTKDTLFGIIAHDLKSPFQVFLGFSELILDDAKTGNYTDLLENAEQIYSKGIQLDSFLTTIINWGKLQTNRLTLDISINSIDQVINEVIELQSSDIENKNQYIRNNVSRDLNFSCDRNILSLVLRNLLSNAIKFTPNGGNIEITACIASDGQLVCTIKDDGIGMTEDELKTLLSNNYFSSREGTSNEIGFGLGLMFCRDFIKKHQGTLEIVSQVGVGTTVVVKIPNNLDKD